MSIVSSEKTDLQNESSRLMNYRVEKNGIQPWGGPPAVRTLAKTQDGFCYADIHVGSIMRSHDEGISWEPVTQNFIKMSIRSSTCPADDNRVYANTQNGVYVSADRGHSWENRIEGLPRPLRNHYCRTSNRPRPSDRHSPKRTERRWGMALSFGEWW